MRHGDWKIPGTGCGCHESMGGSCGCEGGCGSVGTGRDTATAWTPPGMLPTPSVYSSLPGFRRLESSRWTPPGMVPAAPAGGPPAWTPAGMGSPSGAAWAPPGTIRPVTAYLPSPDSVAPMSPGGRGGTGAIPGCDLANPWYCENMASLGMGGPLEPGAWRCGHSEGGIMRPVGTGGLTPKGGTTRAPQRGGMTESAGEEPGRASGRIPPRSSAATRPHAAMGAGVALTSGSRVPHRGYARSCPGGRFPVHIGGGWCRCPEYGHPEHGPSPHCDNEAYLRVFVEPIDVWVRSTPWSDRGCG